MVVIAICSKTIHFLVQILKNNKLFVDIQIMPFNLYMRIGIYSTRRNIDAKGGEKVAGLQPNF